MSLTFYHSPHSSASPVHWTLLELGVPFESVVLDLKAGEQKKPAYLKINPNGKVPALVHDGLVIFESTAIQMYLGETFGVDKGIYFAPGPKRTEAMKWLVWTGVTLGEACSRRFHNAGEYIPAEEHNAKAFARAEADVQNALRILNDAMAGRQYLVGDHFSLVDLHITAWLQYLPMMGVDLSAHTNLSSWVERCTSRPLASQAP